MNKGKRTGADLHLHSHCSDGWMSPRDVMSACAAADLEAVSLTDHDTVKGLAEAETVAQSCGMIFVPGVELSVNFEGCDLHILAYLIDPKHEQLVRCLGDMKVRRWNRIEKIVQKLRDLGVSITTESVFSLAPDTSSIGRPHVAQALINRRQVSSFQEAFARYLGTGAPANVVKETATIEETMAVIKNSGGCAVLAHPGFYNLERVLAVLVPLGLAGLEVFHPSHSEEQVREFSELTKTRGLVSTGGSDFHRESWNHSGPVGSIRVPCSVIDDLKERVSR